MTTRKMIIGLLALAFILALAIVVPALAQDPAAASAQEKTQDKFQDRANELRNQRKEIVKLKYVRAQDIQNFLVTYVSPMGRIQVNSNLPNIMTVSDAPENVEKILAAIRELDVKPADVLYTVQLVLGSETDAATDAELQNDPIVKELRKLLRYKGYTILDSTLVRVINRERASVVSDRRPSLNSRSCPTWPATPRRRSLKPR